jgi:hypothetical protein
MTVTFSEHRSLPPTLLSSLLANEPDFPGAWLLPSNLSDEKLALLNRVLRFAFREGSAVEELDIDRFEAQWMIRDLLLAHVRSAYRAGHSLPPEVENIGGPPFRINSTSLRQLFLRLQAEMELESQARRWGFTYERATERTFLHERRLAAPCIHTGNAPH